VSASRFTADVRAMADERFGTPEAFAAMFGGARANKVDPRSFTYREPEPEPAPVDAPDNGSQALAEGPTDADRAEAAKLVLGDPAMGQFLTGDSVAELVESAGHLARKIEQAQAKQKPKPPPVDFDGGVREPGPPPPVDHDEWITRILGGERPDESRYSIKPPRGGQ
jgi:hypothetical protein